MKTSLLLSSAALLIAGSAYAADLPAKKAAPAAAPSAGCPAYGAGFITIPSTDSCIQISGYVRSDNTYTANVVRPAKTYYGLGYKFVVNFDVRNNTELGTVRSFIAVNAASGAPSTGTLMTDKAYVELGGFRAGAALSVVDFDNGYNNSLVSYQPTNVGQLAYTATVGSTAFTVAAEAAQDNNDAGINKASRPDLMVAVSSKVSDAVTVKGGLVSHEVVGSSTGTAQGFAGIGRVDVAFAPVKLILNAAYANGAGAYVDNNGSSSYQGPLNNTMGGIIRDSASDSSNLSTAYDYTAALEYALGNHLAYAYTGYENGTQDVNSYKRTDYGAGFKYTVAKGLYVRPEIYNRVESKNGTDTTSNVFYLRIRRDF